MADQTPKIQIDSDWKREAQEEKRRLAEQEAKRTQEAAAAPGVDVGTGGPGVAAGAPGGAATGDARGRRQSPEASFAGLVQSLVTQVLLYLGELSARGGQPMLDLDMAKYQIDMLGVLEEKTRGNLNDDEKRLLDMALYEVRMRYVTVAQQYIG